MSTLPILAALPSGSAADKEALRAALVRDFITWIDPDTDPTTVDTSDNEQGTIAPVIAWDGQFYWHDPDDNTTAHDGITCLVTPNSARYKISGSLYPNRILDRDLTTPPADEDNDYGDAYLVPAGADGDWAAYEDYVATWTSRGWAFTLPFDGWLLYVSDEDGFIRYAVSAWLDGLGNGQHQANSVPLSALIGAAASLMLRVENQTTTAPPGTASVGVAYIVGASATGAWLGQDGKIALCEIANTFTLYPPQIGDKVFDKNLGIEVQWNGTAWQSAAGAIVGFGSNSNAAKRSVSMTGSTRYDIEDQLGGLPTTSSIGFNDNTCTVTHAAKRSGAPIRVRYRAMFENWSGTNSFGNVVGSLVAGVKFHGNRGAIALFRDAVTAAIDVAAIPSVMATVDSAGTITWTQAPDGLEVEFRFAAPDTLGHTYYVRMLCPIYFDYVGAADMVLYPASIRRTFIDLYEGA